MKKQHGTGKEGAIATFLLSTFHLVEVRSRFLSSLIYKGFAFAGSSIRFMQSALSSHMSTYSGHTGSYLSIKEHMIHSSHRSTYVYLSLTYEASLMMLYIVHHLVVTKTRHIFLYVGDGVYGQFLYRRYKSTGTFI